MIKKVKEEFIQLFNQGFEEVVLPHIDDLDKRVGKVEQSLGGVEQRLGVVETRLDVVERKLDRVIDNQIEEKGKLADHEKRIKKLEVPRPLV